jgi:hypothetical protein
LIIIIIIIVCLLRYVFDVIKPPKKNTPPKQPTPQPETIPPQPETIPPQPETIPPIEPLPAPDIVLLKGPDISKSMETQTHKIESDEFTIAFWHKAIKPEENITEVNYSVECISDNKKLRMMPSNVIFINDSSIIEFSDPNTTSLSEYNNCLIYNDKYDNKQYLDLYNNDCFLKIAFYLGDNYFNTSPNLYVEMKNKENNYIRINMNDVMKTHDNKYNFYVVQYKLIGGNYSILTYINGKLSQNVPIDVKIPPNSYLHRRDYYYYYYYSESNNLYYYKKALTESQIQELYKVSNPTGVVDSESFELMKTQIGSNYKNDIVSNKVESDKSNKLFPFILDPLLNFSK